MTTAVFVDFIINLVVNIFRGFITTYYLVNTLGHKSQYGRRFVCVIETVALFLCMEILTLLNIFEVLEVMILFIAVLAISVILSDQAIKHQLVHCTMVVLIIILVEIFVSNVVTLIIGTIFIENTKYTHISKYIGTILSQLTLFWAIKYEINYTKYNEKKSNQMYSIIAIVLASISVFIVSMLQKAIVDMGNDLLYGGAIFIGVILLVMISLIVYCIGEKNYEEKLRRELEIAVYKRQEYDINELNNTVYQIEKVRHEFNKVCVTAQELLADGKCQETEEFIRQFYDREVRRLRKVNYTNNVIMNYILNQKIEKCRELGIDVKYVINGPISGIDDVDLHCLITNLWDNAIEATGRIKDKEITFYVFEDEDCMNIEISNTVSADMSEVDLNTKTTKEDSRGHGYGMVNIKNVVEKYGGVCEYKNDKKKRVTCKILLIKDFATKNRDSRHDN